MSMLTPPSDEEMKTIVLTPAEPAPVVQEEEAPGMLPAITAQEKQTIKIESMNFVKDVVKFNPNSPEFATKLADVQNLAQVEVVKSGSGTSRMLERSSSSLAGAKRNGGDATVRVAGTLSDLRSTVQDLTPNAADLTGTQKILGFIPGGKKIRKYFQKYESAQTQLDNIVKSLLAGQDELMADNASLSQEKAELWETMGTLNQYISLAKQIDEDLVKEIATLKNAGNVQAAQALETDMLFTVRQRRQDLMTQLAVSVQGYMAMELVRKNNVELIKGVDRARTTTIYALRTAIVVAQALDTQGLVLDQIDAVNAATNNTIEQTSILLRQQTGRIHEQAVNSGVTVETLTKAFDNIYATLDEIETFKQNANASMAVTIDGLTAQLERAKPQLERARALETADANKNNRQITK